MSKVRGRFYFKLTDSGNLLGEYSHDTTPPHPEAAYRTSEDWKNSFVGVYKSCWVETIDEKLYPRDARLTIRKERNLFTLEWENEAGDILFKGTAMLCDGVLVGDYEEV